jgi:hypothetical protein
VDRALLLPVQESFQLNSLHIEVLHLHISPPQKCFILQRSYT